MDDDRPRRALLRGAQVLVIPAPVPQAGLTLEELRIPVGIIIHDEQHLAFQVGVLEIVPLILRRLDSVTGEHDFRIADFGPLLLHTAGYDEVFPLPERARLAMSFE